MSTKKALVIGINDYASGPSLRYAVKDADGVADLLKMPEYGFEVAKLLNEDATTDQLQAGIESLLDGSGETKLLFFAGHGHADDATTYLATTDNSSVHPGINLDWLRERVSSAKSTVILIIDCCYSGAASVRNAGSMRAASDTDIDRAFGTMGTGKFVLAACASNETALEVRDYGHGVFTFHVLEGMMGSAASLRGTITPIGLFEYVASKCEEDGYRKPIFKGEQAGAVVLGTGFSPIAGLNVQASGGSGTVVDQDVIDLLEQEATSHLDSYLNHTSVPYEKWRTEGYRTAARMLEPIMRWFDRIVSETPEVMSSQPFANAYSEARARLAQLGAVSEGTYTEEGQIVKRLGAGAFGTVWEVDKPDGGKMAYKIYHPQELDLKEKVVRFERGYRAMRQLEHPHIVKVYSETKCPLGFYMDFIAGPNLRDFVGNNLDSAETVELLIKIAETLQHAHGRNVIHRDVKPENIVLQYDTNTMNWIPFLTDFDLAWFSAATQVTKEAFGTIFYASPEQLSKPSSRSAHAATTDVYSFGQVCFFVATMSDPVPFGGADNLSGLRDRIGGWPVAQAANIFANVYDRCTQNNPNDRVKEFRTIIDSLFEALTLIRQADLDESIDSNRFIDELVYSLAGLSDHDERNDPFFNSLSGRSQITATKIEHNANGLDLTVSIEQGMPALSGTTAEAARRRFNISLDKALQGYANVTRRAGTQGTYQVFLDVKGIPATLRGVHECRSLISRAIDAIESL